MAKKKNIFNITFLRHAESTGNAEGYFQGQGDFPLTELGRQQARALSARWIDEKREFDYVISSPLSRTRETAEIVTERLNLSIDEFDPIWMDSDSNVIATLASDEIKSSIRPDPLPEHIATLFTGNSCLPETFTDSIPSFFLTIKAKEYSSVSLSSSPIRPRPCPFSDIESG